MKLSRIVAFVLSFAMAFNILSDTHINTNAVRLSDKSVTMNVGDTLKITIKGAKKKVRWSLGNKKAKIKSKSNKKCVIVAKKPGNVKLTAKVGKKKYTTRIYIAAKEEAVSSEVTEADDSPLTSETTGIEATENAGDYSLESTHKGKATFYDRASTGAANLDSYESKYLTTAMYEGDYLDNMAGAYLEVTDKDGDIVKVMVTDILPYGEGSSGNLDLSRKAFKSIEPEVTGRMDISWRIIALPTNEPVSYRFKPTSTKWWAEVQVRNHRYPVKSLEYLDKSSGRYISLERKRYNYFAAPSGMGDGPYTFRVTDIYGRQIIDENIPLDTNEKEIKGKSNFPYI